MPLGSRNVTALVCGAGNGLTTGVVDAETGVALCSVGAYDARGGRWPALSGVAELPVGAGLGGAAGAIDTELRLALRGISALSTGGIGLMALAGEFLDAADLTGRA